jgi:hypothetical protein
MAKYTFNGKALDDGDPGWSVTREFYQAAVSPGEYLPQIAVGKQSLVITQPWNYSPPVQRTVLTMDGDTSMDSDVWWRLQKFLSPMRAGVTLGTLVDTKAVEAPAHLDCFRILGPSGAGQTFIQVCFSVDDYGLRAVEAVTEEPGAKKFPGSARPITEVLINFAAPKSGLSLGDWGSGRSLCWFGDPGAYTNLVIDTARRLAFLSNTPFSIADGLDVSAGLIVDDEWMMLPDGAGEIGFSAAGAQVRARPYLR